MQLGVAHKFSPLKTKAPDEITYYEPEAQQVAWLAT
jgi:hypothetical protein